MIFCIIQKKFKKVIFINEYCFTVLSYADEFDFRLETSLLGHSVYNVDSSR